MFYNNIMKLLTIYVLVIILIILLNYLKLKENITNLKTDPYFLDNKKYVMFKGIEGFGDRIQCLLYIIQYALSTNRILVIDWSDEMWCHKDCDNKNNFNHYFNIKNMPYIDLSKFKKIYKQMASNKGMTIIPKIWTDNIFKIPGNYIYNNDYYLENENKIIYDIIIKKKKRF